MGDKIVVQSGEKYGRLTVIKEIEARYTPGGFRKRVVLCKCDCGKETKPMLQEIRRGRTHSCGCKNKEDMQALRITHGMCSHPAYQKWMGMLCRVSELSHFASNYRDRGIDVCEEWRDSPVEFCKWADKSGFRKHLELDRIDNNKGYSPDNCRFITRRENLENTRASCWYHVEGKVYSGIAEAAEKTGKTRTCIYGRCRSRNYPDWYQVKKYALDQGDDNR